MTIQIVSDIDFDNKNFQRNRTYLLFDSSLRIDYVIWREGLVLCEKYLKMESCTDNENPPIHFLNRGQERITRLEEMYIQDLINVFLLILYLYKVWK